MIDQAVAKFNERHRRVIELRVFMGMTAKETAAEINRTNGDDDPMTVANVDKITSRFRKKLRELLENAERVGDDESAGDDEDDPDDDDNRE